MTALLRLTACVLILFGFCVVLAQQPIKPVEPQKFEAQDSQLLNLTKARQEQLQRVTLEPHSISFHAAFACESADSARRKEEKQASNPHAGYAVHVYVTQAGHDTLTSGKGVYPLGSAIIKEKLRTLGEANAAPGNAPNNRANAAPARKHYTTELFTGMLKREAGYNPECGDWEFFIVSGDSKKLLARGKIDSCMACHQSHKSTDFVTRAYMPAKE